MTKPRLTVSVPVFRWMAFTTFLSMILIVMSGGAVRLTGSGLGCPDWPTCFKGKIAGSWDIHPFIEYTNRMITGALIIITFVVFIAAFLRAPRRRDLIILSGLLIIEIFSEAVLGAFVVYTKLNPWLVSLHMLLSIAMVIVSAIFYHRSKYVYGPNARRDIRSPQFMRIARLLWIPFAVLLVTGTITTGSGPHAGSFHGQLRARRLPFAFQNTTWIHSLAAILFVGLVLGLLISIWKTSAPEALQLGVRRLAIISLLQGLIGASQYVLHVPVILVELHILGAVSLAIGVTQFHLRQSAHDREPLLPKK